MKLLEKLFIIFCVLVFITFMINHGQIDFTLVDFAKDKTLAIIHSTTGQQYIHETIDIAKTLFHDLFYGVKNLLIGKGE